MSELPPSQTRRAQRSTQEAPAPARRGLAESIGIGLAAGALCLVALVAALALIVPAMAGASTFTILTRSMEPAYPPGTLVVVQPVPASELRIGDVITFQLQSGVPTVVTHRIVSVVVNSAGERRFTTMGDNNALVDADPVREEQIQGRVWYALPWVGWIAILREHSLLGLLIPVAGVALIGWGSFLVISWLVDRLRGAPRGGRPRT